MKEDYISIKKTVKKLRDNYNFRGPLHFTDLSNLKSIISIGYLCSRNLCYANNIDFFDVTKEGENTNTPEKVKSCTRFYFVEKNNYNVMNQLNIPVYLLFSEEILYLDLAMYTNGSANLLDTILGIDNDFFYYEMDWVSVFNKSDLDTVQKQAELLIDEPVPIKHLKNIIFRSNADYKRACNLFGKNKMYLVEPAMFYHDTNYIIDYNIVYDKNSHKDVFVLHFSSNEPVKNDNRHEYRLYDLNDKLIRVAKVNFFESESTDFHVEVENLESMPVKFKFWFYGNLCIEEVVG